MADVVTTIGLKDTEFTGGLSRLESFVEAFKRRVAESPATVRFVPQGPQSMGGFQNYWNNSAQKSLPPTSLQQIGAGFGQAFGGMGSQVSGWYGGASAATMMVSETARYLDLLEHTSKQHLRWKKEIDGIADSYFRMIQQGKLAADPMRERSMRLVTSGFEASNAIGEVALRQMNELGTFSSLWNTPRNVWNKSYEIALNANQEQNRIAATAAREGLKQRGEDKQEAELKAAQDQWDAMNKRLKEGGAETDATFKQMEDSRKEKKDKESAERTLRFENLVNEAQIRRLQGREKEARLLEARVQYEERLAELAGNDKVSESDKQRNRTTLDRLYGLTRDTIIAAREPMLVRGFDPTAGGGPGTMMAALANTTTKQQKALDDIEKNTREANRLLNIVTQSGAVWR